jgi:hypothetical protein
MAKRKSKCEQLLERLRRECLPDLPDDIEIVRTHAGKYQLEAWAWSWVLYSPTQLFWKEYGSIYRVTELLKCDKLEVVKEMGCITLRHIQPAT